MAVGTICEYCLVHSSLLGNHQLRLLDVEKGTLVPGEMGYRTLVSGGCFESLVFYYHFYLISPRHQYHPSTVPYPSLFFATSNMQSRWEYLDSIQLGYLPKS